jgi:hypothetical protein
VYSPVQGQLESTVKGHGFSCADRFLNPCHPERSISIRLANRDAESKSLPRAKPKGPLHCHTSVQPPQGILPLYVWGGHSCPPPLRLMLLSMSAPSQPTGAPSFRVLCERVGLNTVGSEGLARNWKPETRNLTALSTVSGHTFSRADHFLNPCHPERSISIRPANRDAESKSLP